MTSDPAAPGQDRRLTPARGDVAADFLEGRVHADRFVSGVTQQIQAATADLREAPDAASRLETQLLFGEHFVVYDARDGWAWGQSARDGYVGYLEAAALSTHVSEPTHRVRAPLTLRFPEPDIKSAPVVALPFNAKIRIASETGKFAAIAGGGYVFAGHLAPLNQTTPDWPATAARFIGAPYLWGGKTQAGVDCSGLVQIALEAAGIDAPRDSDLQERALGASMPITPDFAGLQRGDLVFWDGHVGIMLDATRLLHANAHHMAVDIENLAEAAARIEAAGAGPVTSIRRL